MACGEKNSFFWLACQSTFSEFVIIYFVDQYVERFEWQLLQQLGFWTIHCSLCGLLSFQFSQVKSISTEHLAHQSKHLPLRSSTLTVFLPQAITRHVSPTWQTSCVLRQRNRKATWQQNVPFSSSFINQDVFPIAWKPNWQWFDKWTFFSIPQKWLSFVPEICTDSADIWGEAWFNLFIESISLILSMR